MDGHAFVIIPVHAAIADMADAGDVARMLVDMAESRSRADGFRFTGSITWELAIPAGQINTYVDDDTGQSSTFTDPNAYIRASGPAVPV